MAVTQIDSLLVLNEQINSADANRLFVLDFYADWCGPCKFIAPVFVTLAQRYRNATFLKVNTDHAPSISQRYNIRAMPTFVLIKNKEEVGRLQGANPQALEQAIVRSYSDTPSNPNLATPAERNFLNQYIAMSEKGRYYQDIVYRTLALSLVPSDKFKEEATVDGKVNTFLFTKALLEWFKSSFFTWCDSPVCTKCGEVTPKGIGLDGTPTSDERENDAGRVEIYYCVCGMEVRFPRYNNPAKLLETRTGRCGEWANCFALIASALDLDVRVILDSTDHVWCEVWIPEMDRWVHCDPCEDQIDAPLLYEHGWKKKLSYVIAFGRDHVCDVTWRYSYNHQETLARRNQVREPVLSSFLAKLSARLEKNSSPERIAELKRRRMIELIEFLVVGKRKNVEAYGGRTTGDAEWRKARGEIGVSSPKRKQIVLRPSDQELSDKLLSLRYNCASDTYTRGTTTVKGWASHIFKSKNVMRKCESDWKKAYLCRKDGKEDGEITWAVDLTGVKAKRARLHLVGTSTFEEAQLHITACADDVCMRVPSTGDLTIDELPSALLKITASFSGGSGSNAFQHAQLFRTDLNVVEDQLLIEIELE